MAVQWIKTSFLGVRYRQHKTRKHGVNFDRCYSIRYKLDGKDKEEVVGWSSEGITAEKAYKLLSEIRENIRKGYLKILWHLSVLQERKFRRKKPIIKNRKQSSLQQ